MKIAPYGSWKSPITSDLIVAQSIGLSEIRLDGGEPYWLESRPQEAGRSVVVSGRDLVPPPSMCARACMNTAAVRGLLRTAIFTSLTIKTSACTGSGAVPPSRNR